MALSCLAELFTDDHTVAAYEVQSSGIVSSLLTGLCPDDSLLSKKLIQERITLFKQAFALHPLRFASRRQRQQLRVFYLKESFTVLPRSNDTKPHILYTFILDRRVHWIDVYIGSTCTLDQRVHWIDVYIGSTCTLDRRVHWILLFL